MFVEKKKDNYWEGVVGPNPRIEDNKLYAEWAVQRGDLDKANHYLEMARDIESGDYIKNVDNPFDYRYYAPKVFANWVASGRNYDLFAILGNVRNGRGFAGVETGDGFNYISDCRGLPDDASDEVRDEFHGDYMHSESYVTLKELVEFDWHQSTTHYGIVDESEYQVFKKEGQPRQYSGGVSGASIVHISNEEMDALINGTFPREEGKSYYTRVQWKEYYHESVGDFYTKTIPELKELSDEEDFSDVRLVFGFDS